MMIVCVDLDVLLVALQLGQSEFKKLDIMIMTTPNMVKKLEAYMVEAYISMALRRVISSCVISMRPRELDL